MWQEALDALYGEGAPAYALMGNTAQSAADAYITDLRQWSADPSRLPQYFTSRPPTWFLNLPDEQKKNYLNQPGWINTRGNCVEGQHAREKAEWDEAPDLLWIEIDYLLVNPKSGYQIKLPERGIADDNELKKLQHDAIAWALQMSGFPATVMISSGSKSVHVAVRLSDDHNTRLRWRTDNNLRDHLAEVLALALGEVDTKVLDVGGTYGWVRTPGASRDNGNVQEVLYVNNRSFSIQEVIDWCKAQLNPQVAGEMGQRPPISPRTKKWIGHRWRLANDRQYCWRDILLWPVPVGAGGGNTEFGGIDDWMFRLNSELAQAGQRQPKMIAQPHAGNPTGTWEASFLFYVQAYVINYMTAKAGYPGGWFFCLDDEDGWRANRRVKWPIQDLTEKVEKRAEYRERDSYHAEIVDVWEKQLPLEMEQFRAGTLRVKAPKGSGLRFDRALKPKAPQRSGGGGGGGFDPRGYALGFLHWFNKPVKVLSSDYEDYRHPFYVYTGKHWEHTPTDDLVGILSTYMYDNPVMGENGPVPLKAGMVNEVVSALKREQSLRHRGMWKSNTQAVAFQNGTLYIESETGLMTFNQAHIPDDMLLNVLPYSYDPMAAAPLFDEFIAKVLPDEVERTAVLEYMGCAFIDDRLTKDFMLLQGNADCGKSTLLDVCTAIIGEGNHAAFNLPSLHDRFALQSLRGKKLIYDADVPEKPSAQWDQITGRLKKITGNDPLDIDIKNSEPISDRIPAQVMLASNNRPRFVDGSDGLWRRLIIVPMQHPIPLKEQSTNKKNQMLKELPGIANRVLAALLRFLTKRDEHGNLIRQIERSENMLAEREAYRIDSDSALSFMDAYGIPTAGAGMLHMETVHLAYKQFCDREGLGTLSYTKFCKRLADDKDFGQYVRRIRIGPNMRDTEIAGWPESRPFPTYEQRKVKDFREFVMEGMTLSCHLPASAPILQGQESVADVPREKQGTAEDRRPIPFPRRNA